MQVGIGIGIDCSNKSRRILAKDSFNRADNATAVGTAETGQTWTAMDGSAWGITGNAANVLSGSGRVVLNIGTSDNFAFQVRLSALTTSANIQRIVLRYLDSSNEIFFGKATATNFQLFKRIAGTAGLLADIAQAPVAGDVLRAEVRGKNIVAKINGVVVANVNVPENMTGTNCGFHCGDGVGRYDDFIVESI